MALRSLHAGVKIFFSVRSRVLESLALVLVVQQGVKVGWVSGYAKAKAKAEACF